MANLIEPIFNSNYAKELFQTVAITTQNDRLIRHYNEVDLRLMDMTSIGSTSTGIQSLDMAVFITETLLNTRYNANVRVSSLLVDAVIKTAKWDDFLDDAINEIDKTIVAETHRFLWVCSHVGCGIKITAKKVIRVKRV